MYIYIYIYYIYYIYIYIQIYILFIYIYYIYIIYNGLTGVYILSITSISLYINCICKFTSKCHSQKTPSSEWRFLENVFSTLF